MTARNTNRARIQSADLESKRKPASGLGDELRVHVLLHMPMGVRTVPLPEPVDGDWVNVRVGASAGCDGSDDQGVESVPVGRGGSAAYVAAWWYAA